jgi:hypothetical protein
MTFLDPWAIDASSGAPAYSGAELRLATVLPFMAGAGASLGARSGVRASGSGTDLLVQAQASPNMTVKVNPGVVVLQGSISSTQGPYSWALDAVTNLTISAAHATLSRTDLIVVRIRDASVDTSGQRDGSVVVITGTAGSGTPALPTDATYLTIAQITVPATVTNIGGGGGGTIADKRTFTAALGGVIPFVSTARPSGVMPGQPGYEIDTDLSYTYRAGGFNKWVRDPVALYKTAQSDSTNTVAYVPMSEFLIPGDNGGTYHFDGELIVSSPTAIDIALLWTNAAGTSAPSNVTMERWAAHGPALADPASTTVTALESLTSTTFGPFGIGGLASQVIGIRVVGSLTFTAASSAALSIRNWNVGAGTSSCYKGSSLTVRQVA